MSLKAKLEAVIYAAEEPVTLNQLALLFADEALEWRAEQEKAASEATASTCAAEAEPMPMLARTFDYLDNEQGAESTAPVEGSAEPIETSAPESTFEPEAEAPAGDNSAEESPASESPEQSPDASPDATSDLTTEEAAKQAARQRDREARLIIRELLDELVDDYANDGSGIEIREIAGGFRMGTKPEYHDRESAHS